MRYVSVNMFYDNYVLVCMRGKKDKNYKKIYSVGGHIDKNETPIQSAIRETYKKVGIEITPEQLNVFYIDNKIKIIHYTIIFETLPQILGPSQEFENEIYNTHSICNVPTIITTEGKNTRWALLNVYALNRHLHKNINTSLYSNTFLKIYKYTVYS